MITTTTPSSVKFLNSHCQISASREVSNQLFEAASAETRRYIKADIDESLAKQLGMAMLNTKLSVVETKDSSRDTTRYSAEVYVLTPAEMKTLYALMKAEIPGKSR